MKGGLTFQLDAGTGAIVFAQAAPPPLPGKGAVAPPPSAKGASPAPVTPSFQQPVQQPVGQVLIKPREIKAEDAISKAGLNWLADILVVTVIGLIACAMVSALVFWLLRKAFGSADERQAAFEVVEKQRFDLMIRKSKAAEQIAGQDRQIAALEKQLSSGTGG